MIQRWWTGSFPDYILMLMIISAIFVLFVAILKPVKKY
jgi:hypothetical protein